MTRSKFHFRVVVLGLLILGVSLASRAQTPIPWSDDFESYPNGTVLNGINGWQGWGNNPSLAASTTTFLPPPLPNSGLVVTGTNDAVVPFSPPSSGQWIVRLKQFIPIGFIGTGYLILLNQYDDACASCNWSVQVAFDGSSGTLTDSGLGGATLPYVANQWIDIVILIDLDTDKQRFFYNGTFFYSGDWSGHVSGGGVTEIGALDLYANGSTPILYDDISVSASATTPLPWADDFEAYADGTVLDDVNGWQGWAHNTSAVASTTTSPPAPLPNSALPIEGNNDTVVPFTPPSTGQWIAKLRQYIPSGFSGTSYLIFLNQYDDLCTSCNWSIQVTFDGSTGDMTDTGLGGASMPFLTDQWIDIVIEIDLDADTQRFIYNGVVFYSGTWSGHISGGGATEIGAINLFADGSSVVYYDDLSLSPHALTPLPWADDFQSYPDGTVLDGINGWQGWSNNPAFAASTSSPPAWVPNSTLVIEGSDDAVVPFNPPSSGQWTVRLKQFIPSDFTGSSYLILLNQYDDGCAGCNWSVQVMFDATTGYVTDTGVGGASRPYVARQWVDILIEIDLDADTHRFWYNGTQLYSGTWSSHVTGGGANEIGALDLFANSSSEVFYDEISITRLILPVELTSFDALADGNDVVLNWSTASETNNAGFGVEQVLRPGVFSEIGYVEGHGTTDQQQSYRFVVSDLDPGVHRFRLKQIDFDGAFEYSQAVEAVLTIPDRFVIEHAHPNPFNALTTMRFGVAVDQNVDVSLVSITGQLVRTLFAGRVPANEMLTLAVDATDLPSGTYIVRFLGSGLSSSERIVVTK